MHSKTVPAVLVAGALMAGMAVPATAGAPKPKQVSPARDAVLLVGTRPVFKVRDGSAAARRYRLYITISTSKRRKRNGDLRRTRIGTFASMRRRRSTHSYRTPDYDFPAWFMARAGTYYWQAYRIDCSTGNPDCHVHTRIRSFRVGFPSLRG
jgi:hypothetical protein